MRPLSTATRLPGTALATCLFLAACSAMAGPGPGATAAGVDQSGVDSCRPPGLHRHPEIAPPYCAVYDRSGRERLGPNHSRRIVGYFTDWRAGAAGRAPFLVPDIPWDHITHLHYAFAWIDPDDRITVGAPAVEATWPSVSGAEMSPEFDYRGHFNLLSQFKTLHPHVKTLISVGGWSGTTGFYDMTTLPDGTINREGVSTFVRSVVDFLRRYDFDGVDIDYEFPTTVEQAGHPDDQAVAAPRRPHLMRTYTFLMESLREALDRAGQEDGRYYLLAAAAPASAYLLQGMEVFQAARFLDYVTVMSYDFHGPWNSYVGHHAPLFDTGEDAELEATGVYRSPRFGGIGFLNADWAYHYFRGALPPGRINLGVPYFTRGWKDVEGGRDGLWGRADLPDQSGCPPGTGGGGRRCGNGAVGIDDLWSAGGDAGGGGLNPMWHAMNLQEGIEPSYLSAYGLDPSNDASHRLTGEYVPRYDPVAEASWLWNETTRVFLSTEDSRSVAAKARYVVEAGLGGVALWELAGDFGWREDPTLASGGEYAAGSTLTELIHETFRRADPYETDLSAIAVPTHSLDLRVELLDFDAGGGYHLTPILRVTNHTGRDLPPGLVLRFAVPTSTPDSIGAVPGGLQMLDSGHPASDNVGGLSGELHLLALSLPPCQVLRDEESFEVELDYHLPITGPSGYVAVVGGRSYALAFEQPHLPPGDPPMAGGTTMDREVCEGADIAVGRPGA